MDEEVHYRKVSSSRLNNRVGIDEAKVSCKSQTDVN